MTTSSIASAAPPDAPAADDRVTLWMVAGKDPLTEDGGGHSVYVRMWGLAARAAGFDPQIICVSQARGVVELPFGVLHRVRSPLSWLWVRHRTAYRTHTVLWHRRVLARALARQVLARPPDATVAVLHGFGIWAVCAIDAARVLRRHGRRVRVLATAYSSMAHEYEAKWKALAGTTGGWRHRLRYGWDMLALHLGVDRFEHAICRGADEILINYASVRRLLTERWGDGLPFRRIPYTCEHVFADRCEGPPTQPRGGGPAPAGVPRIVAVSRHDPRKGLGILLSALSLLREQGVPFQATLAGGGPLLASYRQRARELGLLPMVALPGFLEDALTPLRAADVFVLPSLEESSGSLSLLEAMRQGKAIVASAVDGIPEDVRDGDSALLVPPGDAPALAAALRRVLTAPALRDTLGRSALATFEQRFSRAAVVRAVRALYLP